MAERNRLLSLLERTESGELADVSQIFERLADAHPADIAFVLEELEEPMAVGVFSRLSGERAAAVLPEVSDTLQEQLVRQMPITRLVEVVDELPPDEAADVYNLLPARMRHGIMASIDAELAKQIEVLGSYGGETAGGIMTSNFVAIRDEDSLETALKRYREAEDIETDVIFVVDAAKKPTGVVSIHDLLQPENPNRPVSEVMDTQVLSVSEDADQEAVHRHASNYGLSTVPVVGPTGQLVGIVTFDDLEAVAQEEASEDMYRMAGTLARNPTRQPIFQRVAFRIPVLLVTVVTGLVISVLVGVILPDTNGNQRETLVVEALRFLPIVIALAGNVATIANAIVVRGLATEELARGRLFQPFVGEFLVGLGVAATSAALTFLGIGLLESNWDPLGTTVALALVCSITVSACGGFLIPVIADGLGRDPALTGPVVTALNDLTGTAVYVAMVHFRLQVA